MIFESYRFINGYSVERPFLLKGRSAQLETDDDNLKMAKYWQINWPVQYIDLSLPANFKWALNVPY